MKKSLFKQMDGTYTQVKIHLLPNITILEEENQSVGVWGQRHAMYLKQRHKVLYMNLLTSGKSNNSLADINSQAAEIFSLLDKTNSRA